MEDLSLNVALLRRRVPNLTSAARSVGLRPATVSNLCTGKIPVGRAEVRTVAALASLAKCSLDELILRGEKIEMIETGIKTLDLFAPLAKGGTVGLVARPGMGQVVLLAETLIRLNNKGYATVLLMPEEENPELKEISSELDAVCETIDEAYEKIVKLAGEQEIAFAADRSHVVTGEIQQLQERLQHTGTATVTTFLVDLHGEAIDEDLPYGPLETLWQFDADLAFRHKYPAVNPLHSTSSILEGSHLNLDHLSLQLRAKKLMRRYRELRTLVQVNGKDSLPASEIETYERGERLEAYLTQPFYVAEAFTKKKGEWVPLAVTLNDARKILDGAFDAMDPGTMSLTGSLENIQ